MGRVAVVTDRELVLARYSWLTVTEFAGAIRRSDDFVRDLIRRPDDHGFQIRGAIKDSAGYLIPPAEIDRYVKEHTVAAA